MVNESNQGVSPLRQIPSHVLLEECRGERMTKTILTR